MVGGVGQRLGALGCSALEACSRRGVDDGSAREEDVDAVLPIDIQRTPLVLAAGHGQLVLHLRHRLACQSGLIQHRAAPQQQAVTGHNIVGHRRVVARVASFGFLLGLACIRTGLQGHDVAWQQVLRGALRPLAITVREHIVAAQEGKHDPQTKATVSV